MEQECRRAVAVSELLPKERRSLNASVDLDDARVPSDAREVVARLDVDVVAEGASGVEAVAGRAVVNIERCC